MASDQSDQCMLDSVSLGVDGKLPWTAGWHGPQTSADAGLSDAERAIATELESLLIKRGPLELSALLQLSPVTKAYLRDAPMRLAPLCQLFPEQFVLEPQHGQSAALAVAELGSCASSGRAWRLRAA